jgi:branched-subunit amino acid transport protein
MAMDSIKYSLLIAGMIAATFISRYPVLYLAGRRPFPDRLASILRYVPPAVLIAIAVPSVVIRNGEFSLSLSNEYLVAAVVTVLVAWRSGRLLLSILLGMIALWSWRFLLLFLAG